MKNCQYEPAPTRFYGTPDMAEFEGEYLGEILTTPGGAQYRVLSGPCCRLYWGNGYAETNTNERAWEPENPVNFNPLTYQGKWSRDYPNYLSYLIDGGDGIITVRWQKPTHQEDRRDRCSLVEPIQREVAA